MGAAPTSNRIAHRLRTLGALAAGISAALVVTPYATAASAAVATQTAAVASSTSVSVAKPAGTVAGDVLVATVTARFGAAAPITTPVGWTFVRRDTCILPATQMTQALYVRAAGSSEPPSTQWTFDRAASASAGIVAYRGADAASPVVASSGGTRVDSLDAVAPSVTTTAADTLVAGSFGRSGTSAVTTPSGTTWRYSIASSSTSPAATLGLDLIRPSAGATGTVTTTSSAVSGCAIGQLVALRNGAAPPPPPPPPPPPSGSCTVASTSGCVPGTTLTFTDSRFLCNRALSSYGRLPLKVVLNFTPGRLFGEQGALDLFSGCAGDSDPNSIDLIVDVKGDGRTYGPGVDAVKVRQQAGYTSSIQLTGHVDCGPKYTSSEHQDGVQLQGGRNITFVDFSVGDYDAGRSTCQGAGGAVFYSSVAGYAPTNIDVVRGKYIACNHSLFTNTGTSGDITGAMFRSGRTDGTDPICNGYAASAPCTGIGDRVAPGVTMTNVTCQRWNRTADRWENG
ncbi:MAG: hypothetical protein ACRDN6_05370 [Gaiellaceae bacterium]